MATDPAARSHFMELGSNFGMQPKPTPWQVSQAKSTLQMYRGRNLANLAHQDLLKVAEALNVMWRSKSPTSTGDQPELQ